MQIESIGIADRINRLPASAYLRRLVAWVSIGALLDIYDIGLIGYVGTALIASHIINAFGLGALLSSGFAGMFVGANVFGRLSDRWGRVSAFTYTTLIYSLATLAFAFAPGFAWLLIFRFIAGLGLGVQLVIIDTYVSEMTPAGQRGRYIAISQFVGYIGTPLVAGLAYLLIPTHALLPGWRWVCVIGALGAVIVWVIRRRLVESPRWLEAHDRHGEADAILADIEDHVQRERGHTLPPPTTGTRIGGGHGRFIDIWKGRYTRRTVMLTIFQLFQTLGYFGFASWLPTLLLHNGVSLIHSLQYTFVIAVAAPFGPVIGIVANDRIQRRWGLVMTSLLIAAVGLIFAILRAPVLIVLAGVTVTLLSNWFTSLYHSYQAELYPTRIRATGTGWSYGASRFGSIFTSLIVGAVLTSAGTTGVFALIALSMVICAASVGILGPSSNNLTLEELSE